MSKIRLVISVMLSFIVHMIATVTLVHLNRTPLINVGQMRLPGVYIYSHNSIYNSATQLHVCVKWYSIDHFLQLYDNRVLLLVTLLGILRPRQNGRHSEDILRTLSWLKIVEFWLIPLFEPMTALLTCVSRPRWLNNAYNQQLWCTSCNDRW